MADSTSPTVTETMTLGDYLRNVRLSANLTLRDVEKLTDKGVTNGYLSQIESNTIKQPSPRILYHLAEVYHVDYGNLMVRAGHQVPAQAETPDDLNGFPLRALAELTPQEREDLLRYMTFLKQQRR